jgi:hypothetical protein
MVKGYVTTAVSAIGHPAQDQRDPDKQFLALHFFTRLGHFDVQQRTYVNY